MDTNIINEIFVVFIQVLAAALALLLSWYAPKLFKLTESKLKVDIPDELELQAVAWGKRGIAYAEEFARKKSKGLTDPVARKLPGNEKLDAAAAYFREHASPQVVEWVNGKVEDWLESLLGIERTGSPQPLASTRSGPVPSWISDSPTSPQ